MKKVTVLLFIAMLYLAPSTLFSQSGCVMNYEPNENFNSSRTLNGMSDLPTVTKTIYGGIHSSTDVDFYSVLVTTPGSTVQVDLTNLPKSYGITLYYFGWGNPFVLKSDLSYSTSDKSVIFRGGNSGTYYVRVNSPYEEYDLDNCYTLTASVTAP